MNTTYLIIAVVLVLAVAGVILGMVFSRRNRSQGFKDKFGPEYDRTVQSAGDEKKAQKELNERKKHVDTLDIRPLSVSERSVTRLNGQPSRLNLSTNPDRRL